MSEATVRKYDRRKRYLINRKFQLNFIAIFIGLIIIGSIFSLFLVYYLSSDTITATVENFHPTFQKTSQVLLPAFIYTNLITISVISLAAFIIILYKSHKIAGPIYRFEKDLAEIDKGNLSLNFSLRKNDQFKRTYRDLEKLAKSLEIRMKSLTDRTEHISMELNKLRSSLQGVEDSGVVRSLSVIDEEVRELKKILSHYNETVA